MVREGPRFAIGLLAVWVGCSPAVAPPTVPKRRAGELMMEVGSRFERANIAAQSARWDVAVYDTHELREVFDDDLLPGRWADNPTMSSEAHKFLAGPLAALEADARTHDARGWAAAFATTTAACNACHRIARVAFIQIDESGAFGAAAK